MKNAWEKITEIVKKSPYLSGVTILFALIAVVVFGKNLIQGKVTIGYVKNHVSEPVWTGAFQEEISNEPIEEVESEPIEEEETELAETDENLQAEIKDIEKTESADSVQKTNKKEDTDTKNKNEKNKKDTKDKNVKDKNTKDKNAKDSDAGVTKFEKYKPVKIDSPFYTDRGKTALTTEYNYGKVDDKYFSDAAFIGDSRMLGLCDYSGLKDKTDFYCETGFSLYKWTKGATITFQNTGKSVDLKSALKKKTYGKVYLMLGMNDLGFGNSELFAGWLKEMVDMIKETQPKAIIYLMGNLHLSKKVNNPKTTYNNINVNDKNVSMALLADGVTTFYLDPNSIFTDKNGYLKSDLTSDGCHVYGYCYKDWVDFIKEHAVVK